MLLAKDKPEKGETKMMLKCIHIPFSAESSDLAKQFVYWESIWKENKIWGIPKDYIFDSL